MQLAFSEWSGFSNSPLYLFTLCRLIVQPFTNCLNSNIWHEVSFNMMPVEMVPKWDVCVFREWFDWLSYFVLLRLIITNLNDRQQKEHTTTDTIIYCHIHIMSSKTWEHTILMMPPAFQHIRRFQCFRADAADWWHVCRVNKHEHVQRWSDTAFVWELFCHFRVIAWKYLMMKLWRSVRSPENVFASTCQCDTNIFHEKWIFSRT